MKMTSNLSILFLTLSFPLGAQAELISSHNSQHRAVLAAVNELRCKKVKDYSTRYKVVRLTDQKIEIQSNVITIECDSGQYRVTWKAPTEREDMTPMVSDEIAGYEFLKDGEVVASAQCCEYITDDISELSIRTVDVNGLRSRAVEF